ncbi:FadR/GntR family transcriptional regulator [Staphylococcus hyicus]|uniref:FadR/GntR family transcriptional regulator n=1 Tax=Staphylococcus hyicus TaxID=1284 RepID=UPI00208F8CA5|nr:GntR family transcriptional regulator [Staphylococcus hyicus]MCO4331081.1 GntR family transcriptional regulator [Staphylococcus hyicus]MCO4333378.1 GntR family transcriptional regulator [Staphylococcus hyicus]UWF57353.1 GntR family transcriptional regulator [Staphylococcus hyicus]
MEDMNSRQSLKGKMVENIKNYILDAQLTAGDKLPTERKLAEEYQVSRSVVREALSYLENTGVTESVQGKGTIVKAHDITPLIEGFLFSFQVSRGNLKDLMMLRLTFELAAIDVIERDETSLEAIERILVDNPETFTIDDDKAFHQSILEAVNVPLFKQMSAVVHAYFYQTPIKSSERDNQLSIDDHQAIYEALKAKHYAKAKTLLTQHLLRGAKFYDENCN